MIMPIITGLWTKRPTTWCTILEARCSQEYLVQSLWTRPVHHWNLGIERPSFLLMAPSTCILTPPVCTTSCFAPRDSLLHCGWRLNLLRPQAKVTISLVERVAKVFRSIPHLKQVGEIQTALYVQKETYLTKNNGILEFKIWIRQTNCCKFLTSAKSSSDRIKYSVLNN